MFIYSHTIKMSQLNRYPSVCMYVSESCNYYSFNFTKKMFSGYEIWVLLILYTLSKNIFSAMSVIFGLVHNN